MFVNLLYSIKVLTQAPPGATVRCTAVSPPSGEHPANISCESLPKRKPGAHEFLMDMYLPSNGNVWVLEAIEDGRPMALHGLVVHGDRLQQRVERNIADVLVVVEQETTKNVDGKHLKKGKEQEMAPSKTESAIEREHVL